jgi:hypothetical protein
MSFPRPSASAEYSKYSSASIKSYTEWELAQSAWWAGCDHGDHVHTAQRHMVLLAPRSPRPKATGSTGGTPVRASAVVQRSRSVPLVVIPSRSPSPMPIVSSSSRPSRHPTQPPDGAARSPTKFARGVPPPEVPQGRKVYANPPVVWRRMVLLSKRQRARPGLSAAPSSFFFFSISIIRDTYFPVFCARNVLCFAIIGMCD